MSKFFNGSTTGRKKDLGPPANLTAVLIVVQRAQTDIEQFVMQYPYWWKDTTHILTYESKKARIREAWDLVQLERKLQISIITAHTANEANAVYQARVPKNFPHRATDQSRTHVCIRHLHTHRIARSGWHGPVSIETLGPPSPHGSGTHAILYAMVPSHNTKHTLHSSDDQIHIVKCISYHPLSRPLGI